MLDKYVISYNAVWEDDNNIVHDELCKEEVAANSKFNAKQNFKRIMKNRLFDNKKIQTYSINHIFRKLYNE